MTETTQFRVSDFDCPTCASTVERAIGKTSGVESVEVHYATGRVEVTHDAETVEPSAIAEAIEKQGYTPRRA
ncbi:MAG: heavy-metal-associated domain-containing protein [Halosimplex sp.]